MNEPSSSVTGDSHPNTTSYGAHPRNGEAIGEKSKNENVDHEPSLTPLLVQAVAAAPLIENKKRRKRSCANPPGTFAGLHSTPKRHAGHSQTALSRESSQGSLVDVPQSLGRASSLNIPPQESSGLVKCTCIS